MITHQSNSQGLMFAEISTQETKEARSTTLKGWFGAQQTGQAKALVTSVVNTCKGVVTHTVGEAVLSSFPDVKSAVKAAIELQRRIGQSQNPTAGVVVRVRIGMAYGPVRVMAGRVSGDAVSTAGMLLEKAKPGEILVDQAVKDALGASAEVRLVSQGTIEGVSAFRMSEAPPREQPLATTQRIQPRPDFAQAKTQQLSPAPAPATGHAPAPRVPPPTDPDEMTRVIRRGAAAGSAMLVLQYKGVERRFGPGDGEVELGRALENHVNVPVLHVSRRHAKIIWESGDAYLINLSQNGSCVQFDASGQQQECVDAPVRLEGSGSIALASRFGESPTGADVVKFSLDS